MTAFRARSPVGWVLHPWKLSAMVRHPASSASLIAEVPEGWPEWDRSQALQGFGERGAGEGRRGGECLSSGNGHVLTRHRLGGVEDIGRMPSRPNFVGDRSRRGDGVVFTWCEAQCGVGLRAEDGPECCSVGCARPADLAALVARDLVAIEVIALAGGLEQVPVDFLGQF